MSIQIDEDKNDNNDEGNNEENPENNISEIEKLEINPEEKIEELEDKLLRTVAEMDNMRKRSDKERSEAYRIGASISVSYTHLTLPTIYSV